MSSGKQVSFAKGEVSQKERYKADSVNYQTGLNKLRNMFVRKSGGVSNLSGTIPLSLAAMDENFVSTYSVKNSIETPTLACWVPADNEKATIVRLADNLYAYKAKEIATPIIDIHYAIVLKYYDINIIFRSFTSLDSLGSFDLSSLAAVDVGEMFVVTPEFNVVDQTQKRLGLYYFFKELVTSGDNTNGLRSIGQSFIAPVGPYKSYISTGFSAVNSHSKVVYDSAVGYSKDLVRYEITGVDSRTGAEIPIYDYQTTVTTDANGNDVPDPATIANLLLPYVDAAAALTIISTIEFQGISGINKVNTYRANAISEDGSGVKPLSGLVASFNVETSADPVRMAFTDAGQRDISIGPPVDERVVPRHVIKDFGIRAYHACVYQSRLFAGAIPFSSEDRGAKAGEVLVSKLGSFVQYSSPLIHSPSVSFSFNLPTQDGSVVVSVTDYNGLIAITEKACYLVKGSEGLITPSKTASVPLIQVGGSTTIKPVTSATGMFYVNSDHSRLIMVQHDNQRGHMVADISTSFEHLLTSELVGIVAVSGEEDFVFALRADGKIIQLTVSTSGAVGASLLDLGIKVKNINVIKKTDVISEDYSSLSGKFLREVLYYSGSHKGMWFEGYIPYRDDESLDKEFALFDGIYYGGHLKDLGYSGYGYQALYAEGPGGTIASSDGAMYANIETTDPGVWTGGTIMGVNIFNFDPKGVNRLKFFYLDSEGEEKFMLMYVTGYVAGTITGATTKAVGTFDTDIPLALQNAWDSAEPDPEKHSDIARITSQFVPLFKTISYSGLVAGSNDRSSFILNSFEELIYSGSNNQIVINPELPTSVPVSIVCDGQIQSSPLNDEHKTVEADVSLTFDYATNPSIKVDYTVELDDYYGLIRLGRPVVSEFETLDVEASDNRTLTSGNKLITSCGLAFYNSRGGEIGTFEGDKLGQMESIGFRDEDDFSKVLPLFSGVKTVPINNSYNQNGRIYIKNVDPVALTILSVYPKGVTSGD